MSQRDRARRRPRPRRGRPAPPAPAVLELNGHATGQVEVPPPPSSVTAEATVPQPVRAPVWAWRGATPAMPLAVVFAKPLVEEAPVAAAAGPEPTTPAPRRRRGIQRVLVFAVPATAVVAAAALLAGAGVFRPASSGPTGTVAAIHAAQPQPQALAPAAAPPLAVAQAPSAPILPTQRTPVTGGGGADLPVLALDSGMVAHPAVTHLSSHRALPLPPPLRTTHGGAAADASALSGMVGPPDGPPVVLGPVAPASATTTASRPHASSEAGAASCGTADSAACPADQVQSLSTEAASALATVERSVAPECTRAASPLAPPIAGACTQGIHVEMLSDDPARAVAADAVSTSSLTTGCTAVPSGRVSVGDLEIGGLRIAGGPGAVVPTSTPEPNTAVALASGTVVLNEQRPDRGGHGLTVNAIHVVIPASLLSPFSLDLVIGHSHSAATPRSSCAAAPAAAVVAPPAPAGGAGPGVPEGVLPDVLQVRRVLRGVISL